MRHEKQLKRKELRNWEEKKGKILSRCKSNKQTAPQSKQFILHSLKGQQHFIKISELFNINYLIVVSSRSCNGPFGPNYTVFLKKNLLYLKKKEKTATHDEFRVPRNGNPHRVPKNEEPCLNLYYSHFRIEFLILRNPVRVPVFRSSKPAEGSRSQKSGNS
jgi:hypothetical protein